MQILFFLQILVFIIIRRWYTTDLNSWKLVLDTRKLLKCVLMKKS